MAFAHTPLAAHLPRSWPSYAKSAILDAIAAAHLALVHSRAWCADSPLHRVRLKARVDALETEVALLAEELRIKDARMKQLPAHRRPRYSPTERLAILALRAARAWSAAQTARRFLLTPATIAEWTQRRDEGGDEALLQTPKPVNTFPAFVSDIILRLEQLAPTMGKLRVAQTLARAGLHISASTIKRIKARGRPERPDAEARMSADEGAKRSTPGIIAPRPNHTWVVDLTLVPTRAGFWVPWIPLTIMQCMPFAWWVALVIDQHSKRVVGFAAFANQPKGAEVRAFLGRALQASGAVPKYLVSDLGPQFTAEAYRSWCKRNDIKPRYASKDSIPPVSGKLSDPRRCLGGRSEQCGASSEI
jgi:transposase-like protein